MGSLTVPPTPRVSAQHLAAMLTATRSRTGALCADLTGQRSLGPRLAIVNPPLWEVGHVGFFHDHFALHTLYGLSDYQIPKAQTLYDSGKIAHDVRWDLPLPDWEATWAYLDRVFEAMLTRLPDGGLASEAQSYVYQLTTLHEDMHAEAFLYSRQTLGYPAPRTSGPALEGAGVGSLAGDVHVPGGHHQLGSDDSVPFRFDNEKQPYQVDVAPFSIARAPVTNLEYAAFVDAGGYQDRRYWDDAGWAWREAARLETPVYWRRTQDGWMQRRFDQWQPLAPHEPVIHVSWFEAQAWCRWAGRRLPTEAEWEVAASRAPDPTGRHLQPGKRRYPWGDQRPGDGKRLANLDQTRPGPVDVSALSDGDSAMGCRQMLGNVWEWTASLFEPYPGFVAELYADYSAPWFAERRRVLRGGSFATSSRLIHNGYRNFFTPDRNDLPAGFRTCAIQSH